MNRLFAPQFGLGPVEEVECRVDRAAHLVDVGDGVGGPDVVGVRSERGEAGCLCGLVVARLFEAERLHAQDEAVVRMIGAERAERSADAIAQIHRVAEEEVELVADEQRQHVGRPANQQVVEQARRQRPVAVRPGLHDGAVGELALVAGGGSQRPASGSRAVEVAGVGRGELQVRHVRHRHRHVGVLGAEGAEVVEHGGSVGEQVGHCGVVRSDCVGRAGHLVLVLVESHASLLEVGLTGRGRSGWCAHDAPRPSQHDRSMFATIVRDRPRDASGVAHCVQSHDAVSGAGLGRTGRR